MSNDRVVFSLSSGIVGSGDLNLQSLLPRWHLTGRLRRECLTCSLLVKMAWPDSQQNGRVPLLSVRLLSSTIFCCWLFLFLSFTGVALELLVFFLFLYFLEHFLHLLIQSNLLNLLDYDSWPSHLNDNSWFCCR
ncbi:uncharacterized protein BDV17DRAFT_136849 [Aspergillus undulatus]|uniref:uncharacterized protein n=1 Tax=Aspergillus undulatus TaxID=1810928 RepID=UPI003CCCC6AD